MNKWKIVKPVVLKNLITFISYIIFAVLFSIVFYLFSPILFNSVIVGVLLGGFICFIFIIPYSCWIEWHEILVKDFYKEHSRIAILPYEEILHIEKFPKNTGVCTVRMPASLASFCGFLSCQVKNNVTFPLGKPDEENVLWGIAPNISLDDFRTPISDAVKEGKDIRFTFIENIVYKVEAREALPLHPKKFSMYERFQMLRKY